MDSLKSHDILGVRINDLTFFELREQLRAWLNGPSLRTIVTPNPEFILQARKDEAFRERLNQADLSVADGTGLKYALAALSNERLENRQTGVDLLEELAALCAKEEKNLLLFGGLHGSAQQAAGALRTRYPALDVRAYEPGLMKESRHELKVAPADLEAIGLHAAAVLAVGLGQGKQEQFIAQYANGFPTIRIAIGVGGAFDTIGGRLPRAPASWRRAGLEWLWRLRLEPHRWPRIFRATVVFPIVVISATLKQHRFWKACKNVLREFIR